MPFGPSQRRRFVPRLERRRKPGTSGKTPLTPRTRTPRTSPRSGCTGRGVFPGYHAFWVYGLLVVRGTGERVRFWHPREGRVGTRTGCVRCPRRRARVNRRRFERRLPRACLVVACTRIGRLQGCAWRACIGSGRFVLSRIPIGQRCLANASVTDLVDSRPVDVGSHRYRSPSVADPPWGSSRRTFPPSPPGPHSPPIGARRPRWEREDSPDRSMRAATGPFRSLSFALCARPRRVGDVPCHCCGTGAETGACLQSAGAWTMPGLLKVLGNPRRSYGLIMVSSKRSRGLIVGCCHTGSRPWTDSGLVRGQKRASFGACVRPESAHFQCPQGTPRCRRWQ
ncbi:hypothetical protein HUW46_09204 [Amycolatopsis sp. CA-230715]|nr:hypothetical protein HUW46_09204 [Amycolatopsis sp. CA-230715]